MSLISLARALLQDVGEEPPADGEIEEVPANDTKDIRIIAIFIILVAGLLGGLVPLFFKCFRDSAHPATLILRSLSAGIILSLAIIHVIPDGSGDLEGVVDFPVGPCCVVFGIVVMVVMENLSHAFLSRHLRSAGSSGAHTHGGGDGEDLEQQRQQQKLPAAGAAVAVLPATAMAESAEHGEEDHRHSCIAVNNAASWASNSANVSASETLRSQVVAYMFEIACIIHSFLIGLALGVTVDGRSEAVALLLALTFHQGLEGIGLGSVLVKARFSIPKSVLMICTYSLMTPLGVAIGMGVSGTYDPETVTAMAVQGVLNSVSGGLLLYISLVQLIAEDFTRTDLQGHAGGIWFRVATYVALCLGAALMAMLAIWA